MAPKRSRLSTGSSSQSQPPTGFDATKFISMVAQGFYEKLQIKAVAKERAFLPTPADGELLAMIQERGWETVCEAPSPVPLSIVKEFYANAKVDRNGISWVRGFHIDYSIEAIRNLLNLQPKPEGVEDWTFKARSEIDLEYIVSELCVPDTQWKRGVGYSEPVTFSSSTLNRYARAWNLFICSNLLQTSHGNDITVERAILLWAIVTDEFIDIPYLVHQNILRFLRGGTTGAVPHAWIITQLCSGAGVAWGLDEQLQAPMAAIDSQVIARLSEWHGGTAHHRGRGYIMEESDGSDSSDDSTVRGQPSSSQPTAWPSSAGPPGFTHMRADPATMSAAQYRRLTRRIDAADERSRQFAEDLTTTLANTCRDLGIQIDWPVFGARTPFPPADSPPEDGPADI